MAINRTALLVFAVAGIVQSAFFPGFAQMIHDGGDLPTWDVQGRRLVSSFSTRISPACSSSSRCVSTGACGRRRCPSRGCQQNGQHSGAALLLTVSRSSILALAVGLVAFAGFGDSGFGCSVFFVVRNAVLVLPFLSLLITFAGKLQQALATTLPPLSGFVPWVRAGRLPLEHPWFGVGFNAIRQAQESHGWRAIGGADVSFDGGLIIRRGDDG